MSLADFVRVARGDAAADLVLRNGQVLNVFTGEFQRTDVAVWDGRIAGLGAGYGAEQEIDLEGRFVCPGLIDAHVHIESSMVTPFQFARAVVPRGTTTVIADPHEIANVCGVAGVDYMLGASEGLPLSVMFALPSCVPATHLATAGASLGVSELIELRKRPRVVGLAEFMNVPGAVMGDPGALSKLEAFKDWVVDGHAPGVTGQWLQAYVGAGPGSDHESTTVAEALEKLRAGMVVFMREGTGAKDLRALLPAVTPHNSRRCAFCTDDRHPGDLLREGHIDHAVRLATAEGMDAVTAIQMATLNAAEWYQLRDRGGIAPGRRADLVVFSHPRQFRAEMVFSAGRLVAEGGEPVGEWQAPEVDDESVRQTVHVRWERLSLIVRAPNGASTEARVRVIGLHEFQVGTDGLVESVPIVDGEARADPERDVLKLAVVERHRGTGNVGLGFVRGLGIRHGAIAGSVGHDAHNLVVAGCDDQSMMAALRAVAGSGGGLAACIGEQVVAHLPLPIAGLMSGQPLGDVRDGMLRLHEATREMGSPLGDPFMPLSFLSLEVIPSLRLTDRGLVDVDQFEQVPLWV
jgi:adenine deaminase